MVWTMESLRTWAKADADSVVVWYKEYTSVFVYPVGMRGRFAVSAFVVPGKDLEEHDMENLEEEDLVELDIDCPFCDTAGEALKYGFQAVDEYLKKQRNKGSKWRKEKEQTQ